MSETKSKWAAYLEYLVDWISEHSSDDFCGMSPVCYNEWLDNEGELYD